MPLSRILCCLLLLPGAALGASFEDARSAFESGHLHTARQILEQLDRPEEPRVAALRERLEKALPAEPGGLVSRYRPATTEQNTARKQGSPAGAAPAFDEITVAPGADHEAQIQKAELVYAELQEKFVAQQEQQQEMEECLTRASVQALIESERRAAAKSAMERAEAIAAATAERQRRAVERMRGEITAEVTREVRAKLDARFDQEVQARVEAILTGREQAVRPSPQQGLPDAG